MVITETISNVMNLQALLFKPNSSKGTYLSNFLQNTLKTNQIEINTDTKTSKPVPKLKEPRDLFALSKEFDCSQQAARWPSECQVLQERVQHIEYVPPAPELYYQPTGKEIQPKPVGEEAGTIIFQYYPLSAVNYFSRSSVGGSRYFLPSLSVDGEESGDLKFESRFESGNLAKVVKITETYYELYLRTDMYTNRHMQWYYFRIQNTRKHIIYRFSLVNLSKGDSLYSVGMKPLLYSTKDAQLNAVGWRRCGDNITYYKNDPMDGENDDLPNYTLSFNIEFPHDQDEVYLAHCYPYTYTDLQDYLNKLQNHPIKSTFTKLRLLCRTLAGNNVYYVTITEPTLGDEPKKKKAVVVTARVHPGETPSSWMMKGFMDFLTGDSDQAKELRGKFIFKLVPMLNPDGVIVGNNRCSLTGRDLNRQYRTVIRETYPSIWHTKLMIRRLIEECGIVMYCDLHAHSRKHNVFIYGCENRRFVDKRLQEQVFPLMLHKNAADKCFSDFRSVMSCSQSDLAMKVAKYLEEHEVRIQRSKEGTGRVVVWMMGVTNSYTMEASFAGSTLGSRIDTHFNVQDFESLGRAFCETLLDFCDEEPSKEKLRLKIIEKLIKEGSSADEPTNINLSDYSSDEGDTSSSSTGFATRKDENQMWNENGYSFPNSDRMKSTFSSVSKMDCNTTKKTRISSGKINKKLIITEKTPPLPRKPFQLHKTTLDPPCIEQSKEGLDITTEFESGEEVTSPKKNFRKFKPDVGKKLKKRNMPPELIINRAQVIETLDSGVKLVKDSIFKPLKDRKENSIKNRRNKNSEVSRDKFQMWRRSKYLKVQSNCGKEFSESELQLKLEKTLKQKVWTGCSFNTNDNKIPISSGSSFSLTHWTKGPLAMSANISSQTNSIFLKSDFRKSTSKRISRKNVTGSENTVTVIQKKKSVLSFKTSKVKTLKENEIEGEGERANKVYKEKQDSSTLRLQDPTTQIAMLKLNEDLNALKLPNKNNLVEKKYNRRKSESSVKEVVEFYYDAGIPDSERELTEKKMFKKNKKHKNNVSKKNKRFQTQKSGSPSKNVDEK